MLKRIFAGLASCFAAFLFGATLAHALLDSADTDISVSNPDTASVSAVHASLPGESPVRLVIPSIGVDAHVQNVGITKRGTMSVPTNYTDVGWYRHGPLPGELGSAVMAGHVDNALALPGVFKNLENIEIGADVYVISKNGTKLHFVVDDIETYAASEAPSGSIFDPNSIPRLNLVTCKGTWIQEERQYDQRLVVYTHLVGS